MRWPVPFEANKMKSGVGRLPPSPVNRYWLSYPPEVANPTTVPMLCALPGILVLYRVVELAAFREPGTEGIAVNHPPAPPIKVIVGTIAVVESTQNIGHGCLVQVFAYVQIVNSDCCCHNFTPVKFGQLNSDSLFESESLLP